MGQRLQLHQILKTLLGSDNVYFQPPSTVTMKYPCIVYERYETDTTFADNLPYAYKIRYQATIIDADPDSTILDALSKLPMCVYTRHFTADNLNHDIFTLYY